MKEGTVNERREKELVKTTNYTTILSLSVNPQKHKYVCTLSLSLIGNSNAHFDHKTSNFITGRSIKIPED